MTIDNENPPARGIIRDKESIKAYVHPVRMEMLRRLGARALTLSQLAREMRTIPANLSRHMGKLLRGSLIRLVGTKDTGRNLEKYYRASARAYLVEPAGGGEERRETALEILSENLACAARNTGPESPPVAAYLGIARLRKGLFPKFSARLEALIQEFKALDGEGGEAYAMSLALYPSDSQIGAHEEVRV